MEPEKRILDYRTPSAGGRSSPAAAPLVPGMLLVVSAGIGGCSCGGLPFMVESRTSMVGGFLEVPISVASAVGLALALGGYLLARHGHLRLTAALGLLAMLLSLVPLVYSLIYLFAPEHRHDF